MKTDKPNMRSGKTKANREKKKGESWIAYRDKAGKPSCATEPDKEVQ